MIIALSIPKYDLFGLNYTSKKKNRHSGGFSFTFTSDLTRD